MGSWGQRVAAKLDADENTALSRRKRRKATVAYLIARRMMTRIHDKGMKRNLRNLERSNAKIFAELDKTLQEVELILYGNQTRGTGKRLLCQSSG